LPRGGEGTIGEAINAYLDIAYAPLAVAGQVPVEKKLGGEFFGPSCEQERVLVGPYYGPSQERTLLKAIVVLRNESHPEANF
jgi:hypothetical protein